MKRLLLLALLLAQVASGQTFTGPHRTTGPVLIQQNIGANLKRSMVGYWAFSDVSDSSGRGNTLTDSGGVAFSAVGAKVGSAVTTATTGAKHLYAMDAVDLRFGNGSWTICFWWKPGTVTGIKEVFTKYATTYSDSEVDINRNGTTIIGYALWGSSSLSLTGSPAVSIGTWYFIRFWHDAAARTLNIKMGVTADGDFHSSSVSSSGKALNTTAARFQVSSYSTGLRVDDATFDEMVKFNKVLNAGEAAWIINAGAGRAYSEY